jgi:hypothetical protein
MHGVFATPGRTFQACIRFSNGDSELQNPHLPDPCGMAIKWVTACCRTNGSRSASRIRTRRLTQASTPASSRALMAIDHNVPGGETVTHGSAFMDWLVTASQRLRSAGPFVEATLAFAFSCGWGRFSLWARRARGSRIGVSCAVQKPDRSPADRH